ncbi:ABC transporter ATP-binding protein [Streptomyces albus]|uniref:ABC transporter ATP-binding protein n=1 Tax=Streptomyces albus TaxID=1888 RepID=UPI00099C6F1B|nr:ABC transporter ATP-binding protein [Streptomyces albus]
MPATATPTADGEQPAPGRGGVPDGEGPLLDVRDLRVEFRTRDGVVQAVNGVTYDVDAGETLAVLGESGSGKSVTAQAVMGILDSPPGRITGGEILFRGRDLLRAGREERRAIRGAQMAMIFQDALSSLNPVLSVGYQLGEMFQVHRGDSRKAARAKAVELMDRVRIPAAKQRVNDYPHQFSGGMRQRIMIAMALALEPDLIRKGKRLYAVKGLPPNLTRIPRGCEFHPRCPRAQAVCVTDRPPLYTVAENDGTPLPGRASACHFWKDELNDAPAH